MLYPLQTSFICWLFIYFIFFFCISFGARVKKIRPLSSVRTSNASRHSIPVELQRMGTWFLSATSDQLTVSCLRDLNRCGRRCSSNLYSKLFTNLLCVQFKIEESAAALADMKLIDVIIYLIAILIFIYLLLE